ncbi:hypothetical protein F4780DRAFT_725508 [Xylariomycetidae sp. FL0641]|nr:hypothetical protein F4780DRAFT_725508 [Xylariomycetidae sp. FL0641]
MPMQAQTLKARPSLDSVLDLLGDLDESQMESLLLEANSSMTTNVTVSKGIDFFERPTSVAVAPQQIPALLPVPRQRKFLTSLSPRKQSSLRRKDSKKRTASMPVERLTAIDTSVAAKEPKTPKKGSRYRRISRPTFNLPTAQSLSQLLAAYLSDSPREVPSSPTATISTASDMPSPVTPRSVFPDTMSSEKNVSVLDLLEPSPARGTGAESIFGNPMQDPSRNISGIFEVLGDDNASIHTRH